MGEILVLDQIIESDIELHMSEIFDACHIVYNVLFVEQPTKDPLVEGSFIEISDSDLVDDFDWDLSLD